MNFYARVESSSCRVRLTKNRRGRIVILDCSIQLSDSMEILFSKSRYYEGFENNWRKIENIFSPLFRIAASGRKHSRRNNIESYRRLMETSVRNDETKGGALTNAFIRGSSSRDIGRKGKRKRNNFILSYCAPLPSLFSRKVKFEHDCRW